MPQFTPDRAPASKSFARLCETLERRVLLSAGQLDVGFAENGVLGVPHAVRNANITDIAVMPDGRFVVTGTSEDNRLTVMRFHPDGTPDASFGENGRATSMLRGGASEALAVEVQEDGRAVVVGSLGTEYFILRYQTNGKHDRTFGEGGLITGFFEGNPSVARDLAILDNGQIVVAGEATLRNFAIGVGLARFFSDGAIDVDFGSSGDVVTRFTQPEFSPSTFGVNRLAVAPNGALVLAGRFYEGVGTDNTSDALAVMRFNADGSPDGRFGSGGLARRELAAFGENASGVVVDSLNRPVVSIAGAAVMGAVRFDDRGRADNAFGTRGASILSVTGADTTAIAFGDEGRILLAGTTSNLPRLARLNANGSIDTSFGTNGFSEPVPFQTVGSIQRIVRAPDGTILAAGAGGPLNANNARVLSVARLFADDAPAGALDARHLRSERGASWPIRVDWRDPDGVDVATLGSSKLRVTGPNNFTDTARLRSIDDTAGPQRIVATYVIPPPGGSWTADDAGLYTIELLPDQVADVNGNVAPARVLGTFRVLIG